MVLVSLEAVMKNAKGFTCIIIVVVSLEVEPKTAKAITFIINSSNTKA